MLCDQLYARIWILQVIAGYKDGSPNTEHSTNVIFVITALVEPHEITISILANVSVFVHRERALWYKKKSFQSIVPSDG